MKAQRKIPSLPSRSLESLEKADTSGRIDMIDTKVYVPCLEHTGEVSNLDLGDQKGLLKRNIFQLDQRMSRNYLDKSSRKKNARARHSQICLLGCSFWQDA